LLSMCGYHIVKIWTNL